MWTHRTVSSSEKSILVREHFCSSCTAGLWQVWARQAVAWENNYFQWAIMSEQASLTYALYSVIASYIFRKANLASQKFETVAFEPIKGGKTSATVYSIPHLQSLKSIPFVHTEQKCSHTRMFTAPRYCSMRSHHVPSASIVCAQALRTNFTPYLKQLITCWDKSCWWALSHLFIDLNRFLVLLQLRCVSCYFQKALVCWAEKENQDFSVHTYSQKSRVKALQVT